MTELIAKWNKSIREIEEIHWTNLIGSNSNPFYQWKWLKALEESGSVVNWNGWQPLHLSLSRKKKVIAIAPLYLKSHSYGEFIFDHNFVRLAVDLGLNYYPKLIGMSPFSPIEGYKFLISEEEDKKYITKILLELIDNFALDNNILSCNFLYVDNSWSKLAEANGCCAWSNQISLWNSSKQRNFSDYLARFNANQRRNIKRERKKIQKAGIQVKAIEGHNINSALLKKMHFFYEQHCARWGVWGSKYLTESFFKELGNQPLNNNLILFSAYRKEPEDPIAMSMCIHNQKKLWGRYWGSIEEIECLHFEVCYYSPINWALENDIESYDPGAGGSHKRRRGFEGIRTTSLHRWYNPSMDKIIRSWLPQANKLMKDEIDSSNKELPFTGEQISF